MTAVNASLHAELLALLTKCLCTRAVNLFAQESRQDGESLRDALERYEVDYAWHVLASDRMRDETLALLAAKLGRAPTAAQQACLDGVLKAAAAEQSADQLMSFDNDLPEQLAALLCARDAGRQALTADAIG